MILIVDDKPENLFSLRKVLEINNFNVDTALSGEEALKKILKNSYSLIILDVQMPGMDGFEVAETISGHSKSKDVPVIFLSAVNTDKTFISKGYASGGVDYITKPVDPDVLILKVKTLYRLYEQTRELHEAHQALRAEIEFRKQAQAELRDRVQELHSILESIPHIAFTASANGVIEFVNEHWFKYSEDEKTFPVNHPDDKNIKCEWQKALLYSSPLQFELRIKHVLTGAYRYHKIDVTPITDDNGIVLKWVGTLTDVDEQKMAERKKDEFLSIASHELKTPLTSVKAYTQLLKRNLLDQKLLSPEVEKYFGRTESQIEKLHSLINDLLDVSKIESGELKFAKKNFDFNKVLDSTVDMIRQTHRDFEIIVDSDVDSTVYGDEVRIEQVIVNYLTNAIKYSPENRNIIISAKKTAENELYLSVRDFGVGISADKKNNIFNKYYRVEETSHKFQGLGIGLYICSEIIKRHNGIYGVDSELNKGSTFYFKIPLHEQ